MGPGSDQSSLLTVIITTSPTPSIPSTQLVSSVLRSFQRHCTALLTARVIVVFDTFEHVTVRSRLKKGQATAKVAESYDEYKANVKELIVSKYAPRGDKNPGNEPGATSLHEWQERAEFGLENPKNEVSVAITQTADQQVTFIEPAARLGFGLAVRAALRICGTPYVWVQQHDWALAADIPLGPLLDVMASSNADDTAPVKYVSFPSERMRSYAVSSCVNDYPALRELTASLKRDFTPPTYPEVKVPLTPLFFWYDKPHVASTEHYLARVFPSRLAMRRGEFIEDKIGQRARQTMKQGQWHRWACWLYYADEAKEPCLRHLHGRTWEGAEGELFLKFGYVEE